MTDVKTIVAFAFRMHEEGHLPHEELTRILEQCVNIVAIENGYAEKIGMPFPDETAGVTRAP